MRKKFLFMFLAFAFVIGCQGQYPEKEVIEPVCAHEVEMCLEEDSVRMVIMYHPLDKGVKYDDKGYQPNHKAFYSLREFPIFTYTPQGERSNRYRFKFYVDSFYQQLMSSKDSYKCGFYQIRVYEFSQREPLFTKHFTKCNPNYLRN